MTIWDDRRCLLGEGPLWHPARQQLFWFDVLNHRLLSRDNDESLQWQFDHYVSAAGWVDHDRLMVASSVELSLFDLTTGTSEPLAELEATNPATRTNDGRADPHGGFWISTMDLNAAPKAGAIYRYYRGEVRKLFADITIPNAICFAPDASFANFADSAAAKVYRVPLDPDGWPKGEPTLWLDHSDTGRVPDGAVMDTAGNFWVAEWGSAQVSCYGTDAKLKTSVPFAASHTSCPAFGGPDLDVLFCTSAMQGLSDDALRAEPSAGMTFFDNPGAKGLPEHQVIP